jgi:glycerol-3-phosphate dehydrogenase subunit B
MTNLIIVGAGLSGLFSAVLAADEGYDVTLISQGRGSLSLSTGCVQVWRSKAPSRAISRLDKSHPLSLAGKDNLYSALSFFTQLMQESNYPFSGEVTRNIQLTTAVGGQLTASLAPHTMVKGELSSESSFWIAQFDGFRDFYAEMIAANLERSGFGIKGVLDLPLFNIPMRRDSYAVDLASRFENNSWLDELIRAWRPKLQGLGKVGLPAVLGLSNAFEVHQRLENELEVEIFEIPTLPPSIPGLRLERILNGAAAQRGVVIIEGSTAVGRVDGTTGGQRTNGVVLHTAGGPRILKAQAVLLATGGVLNGGIIRRQNGRFQETVFDLPLRNNHHPNAMISPSPFEHQPYNLVGVGVDSCMRPLAVDGEPLFENLFAAGGIIAGADRSMEGSRQGIDLSTAYCAIKAMAS